eukprot:6211790-Pleurochrysis_carterae.AAC.4
MDEVCVCAHLCDDSLVLRLRFQAAQHRLETASSGQGQRGPLRRHAAVAANQGEALLLSDERAKEATGRGVRGVGRIGVERESTGVEGKWGERSAARTGASCEGVRGESCLRGRKQCDAERGGVDCALRREAAIGWDVEINRSVRSDARL